MNFLIVKVSNYTKRSILERGTLGELPSPLPYFLGQISHSWFLKKTESKEKKETREKNKIRVNIFCTDCLEFEEEWPLELDHAEDPDLEGDQVGTYTSRSNSD